MKQELFDEKVKYAIDKVIEQGRPSVSVVGACMYRSQNEGKPLCCAIGHLILDEHYDEDLLEDSSISDYSGNGIDVLKAVEKSLGETLTEDQLMTLKKLQGAHDRISDSASSFVESFNYEIKNHLPQYATNGNTSEDCLDEE